jgi:ATP-binding cassette subfamily A (ABC1) protein 3
MTIVYVPRDNNDAQIYTLPLQRAVDNAIAGLSNTSLPTVLEYPFTALTQEERAREIRVRFQQTLIDALAVAFTLGMVGVVYHLCGFIASEREIGMSQLIEAMMPNVKRWQPQVARVLSYHAAFTMIYLPYVFSIEYSGLC